MAVVMRTDCSGELSQALQSAQLEHIFTKAVHDAEQIYEEERARLLRIQVVLLEDENDELQEQLQNTEDQLHQSEDTNQELRDQLADMDEQYQVTQTELKACMRDIDQYHTEINALNSASVDATKLLSEKLALSRELSTLKPELEHLKSNSSTQQNILREKLALERELSAVQVELETEKRTVQRLKSQSTSGGAALNDEIEELKKELAKERKAVQKLGREAADKKLAGDAALVDEIEELKKELAKERKKSQAERDGLKKNDNTGASAEEINELKKELSKEKKALQRVEREHLKKATEWDGQKEVFETKLDAFRNKLKSTKDQLKDAQDELERREAAKFAQSAELAKARMTGVAPTNPKKRNVARFDPDMTIGTPGHGAQASKRQKTSIMPGEKSTFSITPFLNRTISILPESPSEDAHEKVDEVMNSQIEALAAEAEKDTKEVVEEAVTMKKPVVKKTAVSKPKAVQPLKETTNPKANAVVKKVPLSKVTEEEETPQEDSENADRSENSSELPSFGIKKKKLLGQRRNIFDDDEDAAPKASKRSGLTGLRGGSVGLGKINLGAKGKTKSLAEFSPLKKDRRAAVLA